MSHSKHIREENKHFNKPFYKYTNKCANKCANNDGKQRLIQVVLVCVLLLMASFPFAKNRAWAQTFVGPIASAIGGAGRAAVDPSEAHLLNPASLGHLQRYYISGSYAYGGHESGGDFDQWGIILADGTFGTLIPGALSYHRRTTHLPTGGRSYTEQDLQIAIGKLILPQLSLGLTGHRLYFKSSSEGTEHIQNNVHIGALYTPLPQLGLGFTVHDVLPADDNVPVGVQVVPTFGFGAHYMLQEILRLRFDLARPDKFNPGQRTNVMAGLETYFHPKFAFRLGGEWKETADQMNITTGAGYKGPRLSLDYTYQKDLRSDLDGRHMFDLWLPF